MISISPLKTIVIKFFEEKGWDYQLFDDHMIYKEFTGHNSFYRLLFSISKRGDYLVMYISSPLSIPLIYRKKVAEYICRVNFQLPMGHFDLNMDDGCVHYRMALELHRGELSLEILSSMVETGGVSYDCYFPGLLEILREDKEPSEVMLYIKERQASYTP